jgi:ferric-dicitrate binding protein FerR (iron transport regulator)
MPIPHNMNNQKGMKAAIRWFIWWREETRRGELQRKTIFRRLCQWPRHWLFRRWLRSDENVAAFLSVAAMHARIERSDLSERTLKTESAKIFPFIEEARARGRRVASQPVMRAVERQATRLVTRRQLVAALTGVAVGCGAVVPVRRLGPEDVIASGHVRLVALRDGIMHAARHTLFRVHPIEQAHTVHLLDGQAAFHLWKGVRTSTLVTTPLAEIIATAAKFVALASDSRLEIAVAEGSVRVVLSAFGLPEVVLRAGEQLTLHRGVKPQPIVHVNAQRKLDWTRGIFFFNGETLGEAVATFNRFNELQIVASSELVGLRVGIHRCALSEPQRFVDRFVAEWKLATRTEGKVIRIFKPDAAPVLR